MDLPGHSSDHCSRRPVRLFVSTRFVLRIWYQLTDRVYRLVLNTYISEIVEPSERTGVFGKLQGCAMFGGAFGFLRKCCLISFTYLWSC